MSSSQIASEIAAPSEFKDTNGHLQRTAANKRVRMEVW
jgi:hypothetical protein